MKQQALNLIFSIPFFLVMALSSPSVNAASYSFEQSGFTGGGTISGSFEGNDYTNGEPFFPEKPIMV
jgi:hypothetical protein